MWATSPLLPRNCLTACCAFLSDAVTLVSAPAMEVERCAYTPARFSWFFWPICCLSRSIVPYNILILWLCVLFLQQSLKLQLAHEQNKVIIISRPNDIIVHNKNKTWSVLALALGYTVSLCLLSGNKMICTLTAGFIWELNTIQTQPVCSLKCFSSDFG